MPALPLDSHGWGAVRFRLLLPEAARRWSDEQLRSVLLHEIAHLKRRDTVVQVLTQIACALHWFNPLVWFAAWRLHVERERACDDLVLSNGVRASAYAEHLLNIATKLSSDRWTSALGLAMAGKLPLHGRLQAILSDRLNRRKVSTTIASLALLLGASIAIPIAMLRAVADENHAQPKDAMSKTLFESWKSSERTDGKIPGGRIGEMAASLKTYMDLNAGAEAATKCEAAQLVGSRDPDNKPPPGRPPISPGCSATQPWAPGLLEATWSCSESATSRPLAAGSCRGAATRASGTWAVSPSARCFRPRSDVPCLARRAGALRPRCGPSEHP